MEYHLYTDASKKEKMAVIAGVILGEKNRPLCEFVIEQNIQSSTESLERNAMFVGMDIALQAGISHLKIHSDNLNNIKVLSGISKNPKEIITEEQKEIMNKFKNIQFVHVARSMNLYANALSHLPFNIKYFGNTMVGYHGVNRAKNRFFSRLKIGIMADKNKIIGTIKPQTSLYIKLKTSKDILEHMSTRDDYNEKDIQRINKIFKNMFLYFSEILNLKKVVINNISDGFYYFLQNTKIKSEIYPDWLEIPHKKDNKIKITL